MKKNYTFKRVLTLVLAVMMLVTAAPVGLLAQNEPVKPADYDDLSRDTAKIVNNEVPVKPAKTDNAVKFIKNPAQPAIYTLRTDYLTEKGEKYIISYQPYIASVGEAASQDEKDKINKTIKLPDLAGYIKPQVNFEDSYDYIVTEAKKGKNNKNYREFKYAAESKTIEVVHLFQKLEDFTKYVNKDGNEDLTNARYTTQSGNTGSTMQVKPLDSSEIKGFTPEADYINMQVPENTDKFLVEYRYNRKHYDVIYDTAGDTPLPSRTLYYEQVIPKIANESIPTKVGSDFLGWKPSVDLKTKDGKTFKANEIIAVGTGSPIKNLDNDLIMPAEKLTFTAVWKDKEKAGYAVQFWAEKADHADDASLLNKYDYIGTRVYRDQTTGSRPDLDKERVKDIVFPDLDQARLNDIWTGKRFNQNRILYLNKFYVYNQALTHEQNVDPANVNLVKSVDSTGRTVYNIYYDRQVYDLYFTKSNRWIIEDPTKTFYPEIWGLDENNKQVQLGGPGNPYHYKARFNQLMTGWPNDAMQTKGFSEGYQSFGWGPNYDEPNWPLHLDTPPYRLNADEFLDMKKYDDWNGYVKKIDKGDGTSINLDQLDFTTLSFGIKQDVGSMPHHMDFWMDGFKPGEQIVRYDLYRSKADTSGPTYPHRYSKVQGFTPKGDYVFMEPFTEDEVDGINADRAAVTPFPTKTYTDMYGAVRPIGKMPYIYAFFNNADEWGDDIDGDAFDENGYIKFEYYRNKYPLRFNYDPSKIKGDNEFNSTNQLQTFYEFPLKALSPTVDTGDEYKKENPANLLDNPENLKTLGLTDLIFTDPADGKLKVKRPDNLSDQMVFKGWALDPAGTKLIWENASEKMPSHPVNLYAKWGEPDYQWKVTFDPNGGSLRNIKEEDLTTERKKIQVGDIGQEEIKTFAKKEANKGDKQVFTVIQRQKLIEPTFKPTRKGYDFMGWEVIRYTKDAKGDYTNVIDTSYRDTYKVPELYSFGNDVVSPIYLKAIWVPNDRVDVDIIHYFLDKDFKLATNLRENPVKEVLHDKRLNYYVATTADKQDNDWLIAPHAELEAKLTGELKTLYDEYNKNFGLNNSYFQTFRLEPKEIVDTDKSTPTNTVYKANPKYKEHVFKFFYRPFRQREYKVNYIDERFKAEVEKFFKGLNLTDTSSLKDDALLKANEGNKEKFEAKRTDFEKLIKQYQIIDPEAVSNGNRHYDARNYRQIPGWVLAENEKPQQQLFFDVNEDTNEFLGINGTGSDQTFFYYKDVRVIEVPKDGKTPEGYVRVTFKADKGGAFTDKDGNSKTELYYDVIKGLKSDLLPVPEELGTKADGTPNDKEDGKYYITPETGKKFIKWDEKPLLNKNTIIENDTKDFYVFTAKFEWSGLTATGLVRTEAFKDPNGTWTNDFAPKIEDLKKQLVWREKEEVKDLPAGTEIKLFDEKGNELTTDDQVYNLVNEKKAADKDELVRTVKIKAKVTFKDGKEAQELTIPITVYKNVYEALNKKGDKPLFLSEAEKKDAKDGGLSDVTGDYVMVTIKADKDFNAKDDKIYWVNKNAWVEIPEVKPDGSSTFVNWTADKDAQNENGVFDFGKRHKFTENTIISPSDATDVVEQTDPNKKPDVPKTYVEVIVKTTDNATDDTKFEKTFWVNPTKEVTIGVTNPTGKTVAADPTKVGAVGYTMKFSKWESNETTPRTWEDKILGQFTSKTTIVAKYTVTPEVIKPIVPSADTVHTPQGKTPTVEEITKMITPPEGKTIKKVKIVENPDVNNPGNSMAKVIVEYTDGSSAGTNDKPIEIPVKVHEPIIPANPDGTKPEKALANYVKVILKAGEGGKFENTLTNEFVYYVSPEVEVDFTAKADAIGKTPDTGYIVSGGTWSPEIKAEKITAEKTYIFNFKKSIDIVEKTNDPNQVIPQGYVTVTFRAEERGAKGKLEGDLVEKIYYVNPKAGIKLKVLADGEPLGEKELAVPKTINAANYVFDKWYEEIDQTNPITSDRIHVAKFTSGKVTLTYNAGEGTGTPPIQVIVDHGTSVRLAAPSGLTKKDASFKGWSINGSTDLKQAGDLITLNENTKATAIWDDDELIISYDPQDPKTRPDGYVRVSFAAEDGLKLTNVKYYYVKKNAKDAAGNPITLGNAGLEKPTVTAETGYEFTKKWDPADTTEIKDIDIVVTAKATPLKDVDTVNHPNYVKVTFVAGDNGVIKDGSGNKITEQVYYVNPNKYVNLKAPTPEGNTGYDFAAWSSDQVTGDFSLANFANYTVDTTITAKFNQKDAVYPKLVGSTKPAGYVEVTFAITGTGGRIAESEIKTYYVDPNRQVSLKAPKTVAGTGFIFDKWRLGTNPSDPTINPADQKQYSVDTTIYGSFTKLKDIIPATNANGTTNLQPVDYVAVLFIGGEHAKAMNGQSLYYVNPKANPVKIIGDLTKPTITPDTGWKHTGWDEADTKEIKDYIFVVAEYTAIDDVIEKVDASTKKPAGYVTVTFKSGANGKIQENGADISEKVYFVNPNKYVKLTPPDTVPDPLYKFSTWSSNGQDFILANNINFTKDTTLTAMFNTINDVIPEINPNGTTNTQPADYVKVTFTIEGQGGQIKAGENITYFVKKNTDVTIQTPKTTAETGYEFEKWTPDTTKVSQYTTDTTVKGSFKKLDDIIKAKEAGTINAKPEDYVIVNFLRGDHGYLDGETTFYVNPKAGKTLAALEPEKNITVVPNPTYKFDKWDKAMNTPITGPDNIDVTAEYTRLPNIIKAGHTDTAPAGYVVIIFETDGNGTITGNALYEDSTNPATNETEIVYFVNPKMGVKLADATATASQTLLPVPSTTPDNPTKYKFDQWRADIDEDTPITRGRVHIAMFKPKEVKLTYDANGATEGTVPPVLTVDYGTSVRLANQGDLKKKDASFEGWTIDGTDHKVGEEITLTKDSIAYAKWSDDKNIIEYNPVYNPTTRPDDTYVRVTFAADDGLKLTEQKAYYVKKDAGVKLAQLTKLSYDVKTGYKFDKWDKADNLVITEDIVVKATSIPLPDVDTVNHTNYVEVKFIAGSNGVIKDINDNTITEQVYYVNPNKYVTLTPPSAIGDIGYEFGSWDKDATKPTVYNGTTTITASFNPLNASIPDNKTENTKKPAGYVTVMFEIDGVGGSIVKGETKTYYVDPTKNVTLQAPGTLAETGYKFDGWDKDTSVADKYANDPTIIKGSFKKLDNIIPETKDDGTPNAKPDGYVKVTFISGANGKLEEKGNTIEKKVYYVNPKSNTTLGALTKPGVDPDTGWEWEQGSWNILGVGAYNDSMSISDDMIINAQYKSLEDVVPKDNPTGGVNKKPDGYIEVTFKTTDKAGSVEKTIYINPNKAVKLELQAPAVKPITGYNFADWDRPIKEKVQYADKDVITAQFNEIGNVVPQEKTDGSDKPEGYGTVTFVKGDHGELSGKTVYYVKPDKEVTVPAPTVTAETGYEFDKWDKELTQTFTTDTTITAGYKTTADVVQKTKDDESEKPAGYVKVTFKAVNGTLAQNTVYYVNPKKEVDLTNTADAITKNPNLGYTAEGGKWDKELKATFKDGDVITFNFKALDDVIEEKLGVRKPDGYVTVKFIPTANAVDPTEKVYFVNPSKNVDFNVEPTGKELTDASGTKYKFIFNGWTISRGNMTAFWTGTEVSGVFVQDTDLTAKYNVKPENIIQGPIAKDNVVTAINDVPEAKELIKNIPGTTTDPLPNGTTINYKDNINPDLSNPGKIDVEVEVHYPNGKTSIVKVPILVVENVVEQEANVKPPVPNDYIKVTVDPTDAATDNTNYKKIFWVKPNTDVTLEGIYEPIGKDIVVGNVTKPNKFVKWTLEGSNPLVEYEVVNDSITSSFAEESRIIANYENVENIPPVGKDELWFPLNSEPKAKDFIKNVYNDNDPKNKDNLPPGTKFEFNDKLPETNEIGQHDVDIKVTYPNGEVKVINVSYKVTDDVVEQQHGYGKPAVPGNFVLVIVSTEELPEGVQVLPGQIPHGVEKASDGSKFTRKFWVKPRVELTIPVEGNKIVGIKDADHHQWIFDHWQGVTSDKIYYGDNEIKGRFSDEVTYILAKYRKDDVPTPDADYVVTDVGVLPRPEDYEKYITGPQDIISTTILVDPDVSKPGSTSALLEVEYRDGTKTKVRVKVYVQERQERRYPEIIYRDRIVEKEKIVEKIVKIKDNERLKELRYMQGFNGNFRPYDGLRRSEAAQILANALKADGYVYNPYYPISYTDIGDTWYTEAVRIVSQAGVFQGYSDGTFKPEGKITRAEWVATLRRFQDLKKVSGNDMGLSTGHWATEEVEAAYQAGWLDIYTSGIAYFDANAPITREEVAAVSNKAFDRVLDKAYLRRNVNNMINYKDINPSMLLYEDILCASNTLLTDGKYYKANAIDLDTLTYNIITDDLLIYQKKFQFNTGR